MKIVIKMMLALGMFASVNLHAVLPETKMESEERTFPQFTQLPPYLQMHILGSINESNDPRDAAARLVQLRRVSRQVKSFIESPYTGKYLMQKIAEKYPEAKDAEYVLMAADSLNTPGALAWVREQLSINPELKEIAEDSLFRTGMVYPYNDKFFIFLLKAGVRNRDGIAEALERALRMVSPQMEKPYPGTDSTLITLESNKPTEFDEILKASDRSINKIDEDGETLLDYIQNDEERNEYPNWVENRIRFLRSRGAKTGAELRQEPR